MTTTAAGVYKDVGVSYKAKSFSVPIFFFLIKVYDILKI